jgi:hypothetical protein
MPDLKIELVKPVLGPVEFEASLDSPTSRSVLPIVVLSFRDPARQSNCRLDLDTLVSVAREACDMQSPRLSAPRPPRLSSYPAVPPSDDIARPDNCFWYD